MRRYRGCGRFTPLRQGQGSSPIKTYSCHQVARKGGSGEDTKTPRYIDMRIQTIKQEARGRAGRTAVRKAARAAAMAVYTAMACAALTFPAFAGNTNIVVDNRTGDDSIEIEVSVDGTPCLISADTGFRYNLDAASSRARIGARVSGDIYGHYDLDYDREADLSDGGIIRITVAYSSLYGDEGAEEAPDLDAAGETTAWNPDSYVDGLPDTGMEKIDLSGGAADTGTLLVQCRPVNAFDEAVLTLVDGEYKTYTIPLHMEPYFFRAEVTLPAGKYRESGTPGITFNESASRDSSLSYAWSHTGGAAFGGFLDIRAGEETQLRDLEIRTVRNGEITDTDSRYYFNKQAYEKESAAEEEIIQRFQENNYQSLVLDGDTGTQEAEDEPGHGLTAADVLTAMLTAVPFLLLAAAAAGAFALYKRYRDNNRSY